MNLNWLQARWMPLLITLVWAAVANPAAYHRNCSEPEGVASIQARDQLVLEGKVPFVASDNTSYWAMAQHPFSDDYLVQRSPYCYRIAGPLAARAVSELGLDVCWGFWIVTLLCVAAAALGVVELSTTFGLSVAEGCFAAVLFLSTPKLLNVYLSVIVDAGAWAAAIWAWTMWRRRRLGATFVLACLGVAWRETAILLLVPIGVDALRERSRMRDAVIVGLGSLGVMAALHALLAPPSNKVALHHMVMWAKNALKSAFGPAIRVWPAEYATGLGVAVAMLPAYVRSSRSERFLAAELYVLAVAVLAFPLEIGRLAVSATPIVAILAVHTLRAFPPARARILGGALLVGAGVVGALWLGGRGAFYSWILVAAAIGVISNVMLPRDRRSATS